MKCLGPRSVVVAAVGAALLAGARSAANAEQSLDIRSSAFDGGGPIPADYSCQGADRSPALSWRGAPAGVKSWTLVVDDPDAPSGNFTHWVVYDLPASAEGLPSGLAAGDSIGGGGLQGRNDFGTVGYRGPCPPKGHGAHRYAFKLMALDVPTLGLASGAKRSQVEAAARGHTLANASLIGTFERK